MHAILDTGASNSFLVGMSDVAESLQANAKPAMLTVRTADKRTIQADRIVKTSVAPISMPEKNTLIDLFILDSRYEIMGYPMILGLDALTALGLSFHSKSGVMTAYINNIKVGTETRLTRPQLLAMSVINDESSDRIMDSKFQALIEQHDI